VLRLHGDLHDREWEHGGPDDACVDSVLDD
jgi:hypothetical protein